MKRTRSRPLPGASDRNETREKLNAASEAERKSLEEQLSVKLAEAEKTIAATREAAMSNVRGIAADAAAAIVQRLTGVVPDGKIGRRRRRRVLEGISPMFAQPEFWVAVAFVILMGVFTYVGVHAGADGARPPRRPHQGRIIDVDGLPIMKPPYGVLDAIDLDCGDIVWQVPHGETPDAVRNSALQGKTIPKTGQNVSVGLVVTNSPLFWATARSQSGGRPRGAMLRAYHKTMGTKVGRSTSGPAERIADELSDRWPSVHHRRGQRRELLGRIHRLRAAEVGGPCAGSVTVWVKRIGELVERATGIEPV